MVVKLEVPLAVITPESVMLPESVSIMRVPPAVVVIVPKFSAIWAFEISALPVAPLTLKVTAPV